MNNVSPTGLVQVVGVEMCACVLMSGGVRERLTGELCWKV